jgi:hypothetical protein
MRPDEYRRYAQECLRAAAALADTRERLLLVEMARAWLGLAQQSEKNLASDLVYETPLQPPAAEQQHGTGTTDGVES